VPKVCKYIKSGHTFGHLAKTKGLFSWDQHIHSHSTIKVDDNNFNINFDNILA
jgi:hypothetical protein